MNLTEIGKTISAASEAKIRAAIDALQALLGNGTTEESAEAVEALRMLQEAEMSHDETRQALRNALKASDPTGTLWPYIRDVYDNWFVYELSQGDNASKLYKASYAIVDGVVTLGDPIEVRVERTYVPVKAETTESADLEIVGDLVPLVEAKAIGEDGIAKVKIIGPGQGSSGYYSPELLQKEAAKFANVHCYWDHPTPTQEAERPERSLRDLAGKVVGTPEYNPNGPAGAGVYADVQVFKPYQEAVQ